MGNSLSCIPKRAHHSRKWTKKSRDKRASIREQVQPDSYAKLQKEPAPNLNQTDLIAQAQTCSVKETKRYDKADIETRLLNKPIMEWDQSGMKLEDLGKMIHCSTVKICRQPCKDINDRCLALFQSHLLILSEDFRGFTYQGTLPLAGIMVNNMENTNSSSKQSHAFQMTGPLLHPFTVYCSTEGEVKEWLYYLNKQRQVNSRVVDSPLTKACSQLNNSLGQHTKNVDLRTLILNRPIQGGERTRIDSLGSIIWISEAKLQHLPFQDQHDRLLILFPTTLLILSEEDHTLHYKGELPLNAITIFEQDESDNDPNTFLIEGKMINQIMVTSKNRTAHQNLIHHLDSAGATVQRASLINKGHDYKHSPEYRDQFADKHDPSLESHRRGNSPATVYGVFTFPQKPVEMISVSEDLPTPVTENMLGPLNSPDYAEPYTPPPTKLFAPAEPLKLTSMVNSRDPSKKHQEQSIGTSGSSISRLSLVSLQPGSTTISYCSPSDEILNNPLSPTYAVPYIPFKLQPAPPAKPLWLRKPVSRHNSSPLPVRGGDQNVPLRKTFALSQPPAQSIHGFGKNLGSFTAGHCDVALSPVYAEPFAAVKKQLAPPTVRLSATGPFGNQNGSSARDQWSNTQLLALECLPRSSLPSSSLSGSSSCSYLDQNHLTNPLSPPYAEPYLPQQVSPVERFWIREEVSRRGSADITVQCSKDDSSEYYAIIQLLDSYRKAKNMSWYSDDSRFSLTSSEHTYAELESVQEDSDYEFWDFDFKQQDIPGLAAPTLMKLCQRGIVDSRLQGRVHRWS
ncbi:probable pleckstrin homology domain-containing family N member 1 isoform X2 [Carcharodon carcharias]|uniref:probable pleckstrin homology domain-containing family N member 1 isoform X2 n=1 Tax=Carcharodon carcharias TaxID=13397 RepID=UPI001B7E974D|nr:probable pleckstrin homology domain-containing family N member 1 isoform X2 [Carcharodon carcharias]